MVIIEVVKYNCYIFIIKVYLWDILINIYANFNFTREIIGYVI